VQTVDGLALVQELASQQSGPNPFLARVLGEIVRAEIVGSLLVFWLLPRSRFHRSSIESSYAETILAFFTARLGVSLRLECRFTDEAVMPPRPAAPQVPEAVVPPRPAAPQVPEAAMPPRPAAPQAPEAAMPPRPAAPQAHEAAMPPRPAAPHAPQVTTQAAAPARPVGMQTQPHSDIVESVRSSFGGTVLFDEAGVGEDAATTSEWTEDEGLDESFPPD